MTEAAKVVLTLGDALLFPSEFLTHADLKGRARAVKIDGVKIDNLRTRGGKARKVVIQLVGMQKKLVANKTNCQRIAEVYGAQALKWVGETIVIKPDKDRFGNEMVDCIRVDVAMTKTARAKQQAAKPAPAQKQEPAADDVDPETGEVKAADADFGPPAMTDEDATDFQ